MSVMVAIQSAEHAQAVIDGLRSRLGRIIKLVADILKLEGLVEVSQGVPFSLQPTCQVQQVKAVGAQGAHGELAEFLGIEKLVGPGDLTVAVVHQTIRGSAGGHGVVQQQTNTHNEGAYSRRWAKSSGLAPATK